METLHNLCIYSDIEPKQKNIFRYWINPKEKTKYKWNYDQSKWIFDSNVELPSPDLYYEDFINALSGLCYYANIKQGSELILRGKFNTDNVKTKIHDNGMITIFIDEFEKLVPESTTICW